MPTRFAVSLIALAAAACAHAAMAADLKRTLGLKPEPDSALADLRGGFVTAGGLTFDIGITTSTYINGQLALTTSVATGPTGPTAPTGPTGPTAPTAPGAGGSGKAPPGAASATPLLTVSTGAPASINAASPPAAPSAAAGSGGQAPATAALNAPAPSPGAQPPAPQPQAPASPGPGASTGQTITATTPDGQTTLIQNPGQLVNLVTNAANDQSIRLDTQVNVVLPGFDSVQRNQLLSSMGMKIGADGAFGAVSALPH